MLAKTIRYPYKKFKSFLNQSLDLPPSPPPSKIPESAPYLRKNSKNNNNCYDNDNTNDYNDNDNNNNMSKLKGRGCHEDIAVWSWFEFINLCAKVIT